MILTCGALRDLSSVQTLLLYRCAALRAGSAVAARHGWGGGGPAMLLVTISMGEAMGER